MRLWKRWGSDSQNTRYRLIPRWLTRDRFGVYLHRLRAPDTDEWMHDHPWEFSSLVLRGGYTETILEGGRERLTRRNPWSFHRHPLSRAHRIDHCAPNTLTLVVVGPRVREWGFFTPGGWVEWQEVVEWP